MAVFTKLSDADFTSILKDYDIGNFVSAEGIAEGVENTNYKLTTSKASYILTVYEKRVKATDLPFFMDLQKNLNEMGFPCPMPVANRKQELISRFGEKNFTIVTFLNGKWPKTIGNNEVKEAGRIMAELHKDSQKFSKTDLYRNNDMNKDFWIDTYSKIKDKAEEHFKELKPLTQKAFEIVEKWPSTLPSGVIHGDLFPDNVLFHQNKVSGVIDFYMACNDQFVYDIAIVLNAWCFEKDNSFNITKANILLRSYNEVRKLTEEELQSLPTLCVGASLRFLSTRLYDYFNRKADAVVNVKDPGEYIAKLKFHLQIRSHNEYGL